MQRPDQPLQMQRPEVKLNFQEIAEAIILAKGIREGLWGLSFYFEGGRGIMMNFQDTGETLPCALMPLTKISLVQLPPEMANDKLAVDAAKVQLKARSGIVLPFGKDFDDRDWGKPN